jgi:transcriptional regulator with XRE-family HTH domain
MESNFYKRLLGDDKIEELFDAFEKLSTTISPELNNKILLIKNRYNNFKTQTFLGFDPENKIRNQIIYSILAIIDEIEKDNQTNTEKDENEGTSETSKVYENEKDELDAFWNTLSGKFNFTLKESAINFRGILKYSKYNLQEFSILTGIEIEDFIKIINAERIPSTEQIIRISKFLDISPTFFFEPNYHGMSSIWKRDPVSFVIFSLCHPKSKIAQIEDVGSFFSLFFYDLARSILYLQELLSSNEESANKIFSDGWFSHDLGQVASVSTRFKEHLSIQYYKLLEQVNNIEKSSLFTPTEQVIRRWFFSGGNYIARIIIEAVKSIEITNNNRPKCVYHFWDEIKNQELNGRSYDLETMQLNITKSI